MERLSAQDAIFLEAEDSDPHVSLAIGAVSILEGPVPDYDSLASAFAERAQGIPRCTQVLRVHPIDLEAPEWVPDPTFDIGHHLHRVALPGPGDDAELFRMVATVMEQRLDRERPLWECWVIEGLSADRWALLIKLHHCIADGIAATQMLALLTDDHGGGDTFARDIRAAREPDGPALQWPCQPESDHMGGRFVACRARRRPRCRACRDGCSRIDGQADALGTRVVAKRPSEQDAPIQRG